MNNFSTVILYAPQPSGRMPNREEWVDVGVIIATVVIIWAMIKFIKV